MLAFQGLDVSNLVSGENIPSEGQLADLAGNASLSQPYIERG